MCFNISTLEYDHPILLSYVIRSKVGDIMYRVLFFKYDVANGITIGTISMNSICKGHDLKTSTCMPCGCNKISSWWVMDRVKNPRFLMCLGGCVHPFDAVSFEVRFLLNIALGLWLFDLIFPLSVNRDGDSNNLGP